MDEIVADDAVMAVVALVDVAVVTSCFSAVAKVASSKHVCRDAFQMQVGSFTHGFLVEWRLQSDILGSSAGFGWCAGAGGAFGAGLGGGAFFCEQVELDRSYWQSGCLIHDFFLLTLHWSTEVPSFIKWV